MKIRVINPNTTHSMTETMGRVARAAAAPGTDIEAVQPQGGPVSIESHFDEVVASVGVAEQILQGEREGADAYIIACFGDPGLLSARELTRRPVLGIAEAAFHLATLVATRFSVVTTLGRTAIMAEHLLMAYGMSHRCRKVRAAEIPVLDLEHHPQACLDKIIAECRQAKAEDGIGALVLGCGGMAEMTDEIARAVGLPVIEGVSAAVKLAESMVQLGLETSKYGDLDFPRPKRFAGPFEHFGA